MTGDRLTCVVQVVQPGARPPWLSADAALDSLWRAAAGLGGRPRMWLVGPPDALVAPASRHPWTGLVRTGAGRSRLLAGAVAAALTGSDPGDPVYLTRQDELHAADALAVLLEGVRETDADYLVLSDDPRRYRRGAAATPGGLVVTATTAWAGCRTLPSGFGCRRGVLERDAGRLRARADGPSWSVSAPAGRLVRRSVPARATPVDPARMSPGVRWPDEVPADPGAPPAALDEAPYSLAGRMAATAAVAVLPGCTGAFRRRLAAAYPHARLVPVAGVAEAVRARVPALGVTDVEKEAVDAALAGSAVRTVLVEMTAPASSGRSLRWVSGRDWVLPGLPGVDKL